MNLRNNVGFSMEFMFIYLSLKRPRTENKLVCNGFGSSRGEYILECRVQNAEMNANKRIECTLYSVRAETVSTS